MILRSLVLTTMCVVVAACAGTPPASTQPPPAPAETFPDPPTFDGDPGDPVDTLPPQATAAATDTTPGQITCLIAPAVAAAGQTFVLFLTESGSWYGKDRYYEITGLPNEGYLEMHLSDGGPAARSLLSRVALANVGQTFVVAVFMRDWDIHGIRPGTGTTTPRPVGTQHEGSCSAGLTIPYVPSAP